MDEWDRSYCLNARLCLAHLYLLQRLFYAHQWTRLAHLYRHHPISVFTDQVLRSGKPDHRELVMESIGFSKEAGRLQYRCQDLVGGCSRSYNRALLRG